MVLIWGPYFSYQLGTLGCIKKLKEMWEHNTGTWRSRGNSSLEEKRLGVAWEQLKYMDGHGEEKSDSVQQFSNFFLITEIQFTYVVNYMIK